MSQADVLLELCFWLTSAWSQTGIDLLLVVWQVGWQQGDQLVCLRCQRLYVCHCEVSGDKHMEHPANAPPSANMLVWERFPRFFNSLIPFMYVCFLLACCASTFLHFLYSSINYLPLLYTLKWFYLLCCCGLTALLLTALQLSAVFHSSVCTYYFSFKPPFSLECTISLLAHPLDSCFISS